MEVQNLIMKQKDKMENLRERDEVRRKKLDDLSYVQSELHRKDQKR